MAGKRSGAEINPATASVATTTEPTTVLRTGSEASWRTVARDAGFAVPCGHLRPRPYDQLAPKRASAGRRCISAGSLSVRATC